MFWDFVGTIVVGVTLGGIALAARHLSGWRLPKWLVPVAFGVGMLGYTIWNEYTWYPRVVAGLPVGVEVILAPQDQQVYRPWTYLAPLSLRFIALDKTVMKTSGANPDLRVARAMIVQRWAPTKFVPMAFDCGANRIGDLIEGAVLAEDGTLTGVEWRDAGPDDPMIQSACREG